MKRKQIRGFNGSFTKDLDFHLANGWMVEGNITSSEGTFGTREGTRGRKAEAEKRPYFRAIVKKDESESLNQLTKDNLIHMILGGCTPQFEQMNELTEQNLGNWRGGMGEMWMWNIVGLSFKTTDELLSLYNKIVSS